MTNRVGPPTPRNEPWRMPTPPLPEQPGRTPVPARERAFEAWAGRGLCVATAGERAFAKAVFFAGWDARKRAEMLAGQRARDYVKSPPNTSLVEHVAETDKMIATMFPTMEIGGDV